MLTLTGWNIYLSWLNNANNTRLADAAAQLALAHGIDAEKAARLVEEAKARREEIRGEEGGGAIGVATRLGWS